MEYPYADLIVRSLSQWTVTYVHNSTYYAYNSFIFTFLTTDAFLMKKYYMRQLRNCWIKDLYAIEIQMLTIRLPGLPVQDV